ncbi:YbbR-like domain-containing protein [Pedobacter sp. LMG 31464]|uniref:YbbR-like domain-containing protein n=1 Tax=Pedobacter planticolens TaxID=2679964 RepID=A0A923IU19_9SPHI|nr:YbbR-like domain-containing protein [Pedobacter planticolens]MBB2145410.1 YbbR-like domain-containing protein [Pedobacter planticolens]
MPFIKLTKIERKRFVLLITCLLCAIAAWLFMALNNKYVYTAKTELIYKDEPQKKAFKPLQPDIVDLQVEGTGWQLLFSRLRIKPQSITVSLEKLTNRNFILFSEQLPQINKQLGSAQKIISIKPDTLYFDFSKRTNKRVPIKLVSNLSFVKQYGISNQIHLTPAYVNISGPQEELAKISMWYTDTLKLDDLQKPTNTRIAIKQNNSNNISIYPSSVGVKIPVDEFTEKTVEVPLNIINNKDFYDIKLYPKKVAVTFMVALSSYQEVDEDFIEATVDVNEWKQLGHHKFSVKITRFPNYCKLLSVTPNKINFIIEK